MALALVRYQFRGRGATNLLIFLPLATPEIVLGASLLSLFLIDRLATRLHDDPDRARHVLISFVVVDGALAADRVRPQPRGGRRRTSARTGSTTFLQITLPLIAPGVLAAALLAFALSIDDFVITNFNSGIDR